MFGRNANWRSVTPRPISSSVRKNVLKKLAGVFMSARPGTDFVPLENAFHRDPHERHRDEDLPAEPHDLIVAVARERGAEPQEAEQEERDLEEQPDEARRAQQL